MIQKFLNYIKTQPRKTRDFYAFFGASIATLLIAGVWATYMSVNTNTYLHTASLSQINNQEEKADQEKSAPPFSTFFKQMKEQVSGLWTEVERVENTKVNENEDDTEDFSADSESLIEIKTELPNQPKED